MKYTIWMNLWQIGIFSAQDVVPNRISFEGWRHEITIGRAVNTFEGRGE